MADIGDLFAARLIYSLKCDEIPVTAQVVAFRGTEGLSQLYSFEIALILKDGALDPDALANTPATFTIHHAEPILFHGVVASVELVHAWQGESLYRVVVAPKLWLSTLTHHSRIWVDMASPDFIQDVLKRSGLAGSDFELRLEQTYDTQLHVCQYQESDFAFIARWMEREGMYFFFEQGEEGEKLVIADSKSHHGELRDKPVRYVPLADKSAMAEEAFETFMTRRSVQSAEVLLRDYDYLHPALALEGTGQADLVGQVQMFGMGFRATAEGKRLAKMRAEEILAGRRVCHARGRVHHLRAGYKFRLHEHPQSALNTDYLVTQIVHLGNQQGASEHVAKLLGIDDDVTYRVDVVAIPADVQYRAPRQTPVPRIYGVINAVIDGPATSTYAQLDEYGRYKVKLMLDESGLDDGDASTWVRMLQFHGGGTEGVHFPLRKETEVLIIFLGGDPDRPMICGVAPNTHKPSPVTQKNHTWNVLKTGGSNHLVIQDLDGSQYVDWYSPTENTFLHLGAPHSDDYGSHTHNIVLNTEGDCLFNIGGNQDIEIGGDLSEHVVGDVWENYESDQDSYVGGDQTLEVGGDQDTEIGGDQTLEVGGDQDTEIGGDQTLEVGGDQDGEIGGDCTLEVGGDNDIEIGGDQTVEIGGDQDTEIGGDQTLEVGGDQSGDIGGNVVYTVGGNWTQTITGDYENTHAGSGKFWTVGNEAKGTLGSTFEIFVGNKAEIKIGNFMELALANKLGLHVGSDISISVALKLEITAGAKISANSAVNVEVSGGPEARTAPTILAAAGLIMQL